MKAVQKLLGAPTIGRGACPDRGWWWRKLKEVNKPLAGRNIQKQCWKRVVSSNFWLKNSPKTPFFTQKYSIRYTPKMFLRYTLIKILLLFKALWSYTCSKFWESYTPQAIWIRVKQYLNIVLHTLSHRLRLCTYLYTLGKHNYYLVLPTC